MTVSSVEHTAIGALGGICEVLVMQPMVAIKNAMQEGRPVPTSLPALYRGLGMNIASMAPITATQFGTAKLVQSLVLPEGGEPGDVLRIGSALIAGGTSALVATPFEMIVIHQQKSGRSLGAEMKNFMSEYGLLAFRRGLLPCVLRESPYAAGYLGLMPVIKSYLDRNYDQSLPAGASMVISGVAGGSCGAFASQPFDTMKTRMQAYMYSKPEYMTLRSTFWTIYKEGGIMRFWAGVLPRMTRIVGATFILNYVRTASVDYLDAARA